MIDAPHLANFEAKFPGVVSTIEFALPHPKNPMQFYIVRRNPFYKDAYTYDSVFTCELSDKPAAN